MVFVLAACSGDEPDKYCTNCGKGITNSVSFCQNCGAAVNDTSSKTETSSAEETSSTPESSSSSNPNSSSKPSTTSHTSSKPTQTPKPTSSTKPTSSNKPATSSKPIVNPIPVSSKPVHTHSYSQKITDPTCTEKGYTTYTCSCGDSYTSNYVEPKHTYTDYVCSKCGTVDKSHAHEYLVEYIKKNGTVKGEYINIYEYHNDLQCGISYQSGSGAYVSVLKSGDNGDDSDTQYVSVDLISKNQKFKAYCSYGYNPVDTQALFELDGKTFTSNSPITCTNYDGDSSNRPNFMEYSRQGIDLALSFLENYLIEKSVGITLADLGFTAY